MVHQTPHSNQMTKRTIQILSGNKSFLRMDRAQYNTDHHKVIIRPFMQNHSSTMQLTSPISSENLMQSSLGGSCGTSNTTFESNDKKNNPNSLGK